MIQSFDRHWPPEITLYFYTEEFVPQEHSGRVLVLNLLTSCPELVAFKERHLDDARGHGEPPLLSSLVVKTKDRKAGAAMPLPRLKVRWVRGRSYLWDAVRFSHKMFAIFDAVERCKADVLFWVDADVFTFADVPLDYLDSLVPRNCLLSFLRRPYYSECGFVGYNLRHPAIHNFISSFKHFYTNDTLFREKQYHDSWLFDVLRRKFESLGCQTHDIAGGLGARGGMFSSTARSASTWTMRKAAGGYKKQAEQRTCSPRGQRRTGMVDDLLLAPANPYPLALCSEAGASVMNIS